MRRAFGAQALKVPIAGAGIVAFPVPAAPSDVALIGTRLGFVIATIA